MRGSIIIFVFTFFVHELLADVIYKIDDVCRGLKRRPTTKDILRRHFSRRQFGAILDIPRGEAVSVILGNPQPQEGLLSSYQPSYGKNEADPVKTNLDCRFTLKPPKPGSNVIHSPDMILIRMTATGSYTFTSTLYFPLHVRISVCESAPSSLGFLLVASSTAEEMTSVHSVLSVFSFLGPCLFLLLIVISAVFACCCYWPIRFHRHSDLNSGEGTPTSEALDSVVSSGDKPPTYDELFPPKAVSTGAEGEPKAETIPPPSYDTLRSQTSRPLPSSSVVT